jgi:hypothetical protein
VAPADTLAVRFHIILSDPSPEKVGEKARAVVGAIDILRM